MTTAIFASATAVVLYWLMLRYQRGLGRECAMGLVPTASTSDGNHNDCECGSHYMDAGDTKTVLKRLGFIAYYVQGWMQKNEKYLRFVLPLAH